MSVYCDHSLYKPKGCGYVLKCTNNNKTYWVHKTYPSLQGVKRMLLSRIYDEADIFYVYKIPEDSLIAIALPYDGDNYWRKNTFVLKELSEFNHDESSVYINTAKSFYEDAQV
jgi:hypothetical protein